MLQFMTKLGSFIGPSEFADHRACCQNITDLNGVAKEGTSSNGDEQPRVHVDRALVRLGLREDAKQLRKENGEARLNTSVYRCSNTSGCNINQT